MPEADHAELLAALALGRASAFDELIDRFGPLLWRTARTLTANEHEAEDVVQETLLALVRLRDGFTQIQNLPAYLVTCLRNVIHRRHARSRRQRVAAEQWFQHTSPSVPATEPADPDPELRSAIARLPDSQREVLSLKLDAGLTFREIGALLHVSPHTAASRYRYALERLRQQLPEDDP